MHVVLLGCDVIMTSLLFPSSGQPCLLDLATVNVHGVHSS